ncbi:hypothetical protein PCE1_004089 [Barthelona sp. PCE]
MSVVGGGNRSAPSVYSAKSSKSVFELYLPYNEDLPIVEEKIDAIMRNNEFLQRENTLFESYLQRHAAQVAAVNESEIRKKGRFFLNLDQKYQTIQKELDDLRDDGESVKVQGEQFRSRLIAMLESCKQRCTEIKKETIDLEKILGSDSEIELVKRYYKNLLKGKKSKIEKMRLKISNLRKNIKKTKFQLHNKQNFGENFQQIDFEELRIETRQFADTLEQKNAELLGLKLISGNMTQALNTLKDKLSVLLVDNTKLKKEINTKKQLISKLTDDIDSIMQQNDSLETEAATLKLQSEHGEGPSIYEYIQINADLQTLKKQVETWQRKVVIAEMTAENNNGGAVSTTITSKPNSRRSSKSRF